MRGFLSQDVVLDPTRGGRSGASVGFRSGVSIATTLPKFSLLYLTVPGTSTLSRSICVTFPFSSVMIARVPLTVYLARAKTSVPSFSLTT